MLPLQAWRPAVFNGTALVVGSVAPDLQYFFWTKPQAADFGHTLLGQLVFCLPITMTVVLLVGHLRLGEVLAARLGRRIAWLADAATDVTRAGGIRRALSSALLGSFSHIGLDLLTHRVLPQWLPHATYRVHGIVFSMHSVAQAAVSLLGALVALWMLRRISLQSTRDPPAKRPGAAWLPPFAFAGGAIGLARSLPAIHHPTWYFEAGPIYVWGYVAFQVVVGATAALLFAATLLAVQERRTASR